jgi:hypothetical protein
MRAKRDADNPTASGFMNVSYFGSSPLMLSQCEYQVANGLGTGGTGSDHRHALPAISPLR